MTNKNSLSAKKALARSVRFMELTSNEESTMNEAFQRLVEGDSLKDICRAWDVPFGRFLSWVMSDDKRYSIYNRAMEVLAHIEVDEAKTIADTPLIGRVTKIKKDQEGNITGTEVSEEDLLAHRKLQVETRFRRAKYHAPERYGDKQEVQIQEPIEAVLEVSANELIKLIRKAPKEVSVYENQSTET